MNLLSIIHYPVFGGPHNQVMRLSPHLRAQGIQATVLLPKEARSAAKRLQDAGVDVATISLHRLRATPSPAIHAGYFASMWGEVAAIRKIITNREIDVVEILGLVNPHGALAGRLEDRPIVWHLLDTRAPQSVRHAVMPLVDHLADSVMATGLTVARQHPRFSHLHGRLITYLPPVDTEEFTPNLQRRARGRLDLGVRPDAQLVGTVANLTRQKGLEYLLQAAALISAENPEAQIRILGSRMMTKADARYEARLRGEAKALGLLRGGTLRFIDPGGRVGELLPAFDVFLLTSPPRSEGIPTTVLEAMACGVPVVAVDVGSVREAVQDGVTGSIVPRLNPMAVADATLKLLSNRRLRHLMGAAAREHAVQRFATAYCAEEHVRAYDLAVRRHRGLAHIAPSGRRNGLEKS